MFTTLLQIFQVDSQEAEGTTVTPAAPLPAAFPDSVLIPALQP